MTNLDKSTQEIQQAILEIKDELDKFVDVSSTALAELYDPTLLQQRIIDEARKKLQSKQDNWTCSDFGLSSLRNLSSNCRNMLNLSSVQSLDQSSSFPPQLEADQTVIPVATEEISTDLIDDSIDDSSNQESPAIDQEIPVSKTKRMSKNPKQIFDQMKQKTA